MFKKNSSDTKKKSVHVVFLLYIEYAQWLSESTGLI